MTDFELLKALQKELIDALNERKKVGETYYVPKTCNKAKIHRLRLQIQEVMMRIEQKCGGFFKKDKEGWE